VLDTSQAPRSVRKPQAFDPWAKLIDDEPSTAAVPCANDVTTTAPQTRPRRTSVRDADAAHANSIVTTLALIPQTGQAAKEVCTRQGASGAERAVGVDAPYVRIALAERA
jgi:hypothetical protein